MNLFFNEALLEVLSPEEAILISLALDSDNDSCYYSGFFENFMSSNAYEKLFNYYLDEIPYEVAKCRSDCCPDTWILNRLRDELFKLPLD
jgi:hypothetical protein|tara:strand:- start:1159 stop:1428 length:270 start_codon:yes stop_codon:yes gene_type:complete